VFVAEVAREGVDKHGLTFLAAEIKPSSGLPEAAGDLRQAPFAAGDPARRAPAHSVCARQRERVDPQLGHDCTFVVGWLSRRNQRYRAPAIADLVDDLLTTSDMSTNT
jgi:hypothetical protein